MFEPFATFEPLKSVFLEHPVIREELQLKANTDLDLKPGTIVTLSKGVVALATNSIAVTDDIAVIFGPVTVNATKKTAVTVVRHCEIAKGQAIVADGASINTIAAVVAQKGIYIHL